ncbi:hypothetical protein, partial [Klebsiella pneumoniae]|uniref:hypothetical protein n=1 Tax=Klebsiella pneumoniae TaxID=573 RepID=UPI00210903C6
MNPPGPISCTSTRGSRARCDAVRRLIQRDKTPLAVLFMAAVVGTLRARKHRPA